MATILIVDDRIVNRQFLATLLGYGGHRVLEAANGAEALEQVNSEHPDLVITDLVMPVMDGVEFTQRLRQTPSIAATPVIFYTATFRTTEAQTLAQACGVSIVLPKPSEPQAILHAVFTALGYTEAQATPVPETAAGQEQWLGSGSPLLQGAGLQLATLIELGMLLASEREPGRLLHTLCRATQDILTARFAAVGILDDEGKSLQYFFASGMDGMDQAQCKTLLARVAILDEVIAEKQPRRLHGLAGDPQSLGFPSFHPPVHNLLAVPMANANSVYGWIYVVDKLDATAFSALDEELAATLAAQAAVIYNNVMLYDELQRHAKALQLEVAERRLAQQALEEQRQFLRAVIDTNPNLIFVKDGNSRFVLGNQSLAKLYGTTPDDLIGHTDADFNPHAEEVQAFVQDDREVISSLQPKLIAEERVTNPLTGEAHWFQTIKVPLVGNAKSNPQLLGVATDITERKRQQEKLVQLARGRTVMSSINSAIVRIHDRQKLLQEACRIVVEDGQFRMAWAGLAVSDFSKVKPVAWAGVNDGYLDEVGRQLEDNGDDLGCGGLALRQRRAVIINDVSSDPRVVFKKEALARGYRSLAVFPLQVQDRVEGVFALYAEQPDFFNTDEVLLLDELAADLSFALDYIAKTKEANYLAYYDVITGLANRALFLEWLDQVTALAAENKWMYAVIVIGIERFRSINHTLGRQGGDSVLKFLAKCLRDMIHTSGRVARVGHDTFALLFPSVRGEAEAAALLEETLIPSCVKPLQVGGHELRISVKAGIAFFPGDGTNAEILMNNAEAALDKAKAVGSSYLFYTAQMNEKVAGKLILESRLQRALENEEFVLYYQPKLDLATETLVGLEALLRWNDPETGLIPPMEFIPLLEETGMILEAGQWIMRQALSDYDSWQTAGLQPPPIAVNVSPIQLRQQNFVATVRDLLKARAADFHGLDLEITESVVMDNIEANNLKLKAIREMGVHISIDDFGTGYSSLSYLAKLPISALKIDRSFISVLADNPDAMSIVAAIISLAHDLKLQVIAEGIETEQQKSLLHLLKCDQGQGYLFQAPIPASQIVRMLEQKHH